MIRKVIGEGVAGIIAALPEDSKIEVSVHDLPRARFDLLRGKAEVQPMPRSRMECAVVDLGGNVFLELYTREERTKLRSVS